MTNAMLMTPMPCVASALVELLGPSRCGSLIASCRLVGEDFRDLLSRPQHGDSGSARSLCATLWTAAAGGYSRLAGPVALHVEDAVYMALMHPAEGSTAKDVLQGHPDLTKPEDIAELIAALKPRCKVPAAVLDVIFAFKAERSNTFFLHPKPLHSAVMCSEIRLTRLLLAAAADWGVLEESLQLGNQEGSADTFTPLFLAMLFAERETVDVLLASGAAFNEVDLQAALRLQRLGWWTACAARLGELEIGDQATQLHARLAAKHTALERYRAEARAKREALLAQMRA